jgi:hypothetical protein
VINAFASDLFPTRFAASSATRIDYPKHNNRDYSQYGMAQADQDMQSGYYAEATCVVADEGPIPPGNRHYYYGTKRFFMDAAGASAFFNAQPTPAQQTSHAAGGVTFQDDPEASGVDTRASYISWQPPEAPSTLPGYGFSRLQGPIVSHFNVYQIDQPADGPTAIDPAHPLYQSLRDGVLDILDQQLQLESGLGDWPVYETPETFAG